jgi:hypothetical protein
MFTQRENFLSDKAFDELRDAAATVAFRDIRSDVDGVTYPEISMEVPNLVRLECEFLAQRSCRRIFMRRSPKGVTVPNIHHTDNSMGDTSLMLYLDKYGDDAGTAFVRHWSMGVNYAPRLEALVDLLRKDANTVEAWIPYAKCEAEANRACIFDAGYFHRAEPIGGYGEGAEARTVLTAFYD